MSDPVLTEHLRQLEEQLLRREVRREPQRVADLLADDFREFGSSGRVFDKTSVLKELATEQEATLALSDFACERLSPEIALVTYRSQRTDASGIRNALRSSVWVLRDGRWQMLFHQGTPA
jgi:hypothetical protein